MTRSHNLRLSVALTAGAMGLVAVTVAGVAAKPPVAEPMASKGEDRREWTLEAQDDGTIEMRLTRRWKDGGTNRSSWSFDSEPSAIEGLPRGYEDADDIPVRLTIRRDPGSFVLEGRVREGFGKGPYTFEPDDAFRRRMVRAGMKRPDDTELERMSTHDVRLETIEALADQGYDGLSSDDLIRLAVHDASPEFVGKMVRAGYEGLTVEDLVRLRIHDVSPEFALGYAALGLRRLTPEDIVRLRIHDVPPALARRALAENPKLTPDDLIRLRLHGKL